MGNIFLLFDQVQHSEDFTLDLKKAIVKIEFLGNLYSILKSKRRFLAGLLREPRYPVRCLAQLRATFSQILSPRIIHFIFRCGVRISYINWMCGKQLNSSLTFHLAWNFTSSNESSVVLCRARFMRALVCFWNYSLVEALHILPHEYRLLTAIITLPHILVLNMFFRHFPEMLQCIYLLSDFGSLLIVLIAPYVTGLGTTSFLNLIPLRNHFFFAYSIKDYFVIVYKTSKLRSLEI
ncbi:hypothetical protein P8452_66499 [Trifolium repens]|nr:hypothetical protein P8452_66499 [Trifolium repens]